jgi:hypothetical protein
MYIIFNDILSDGRPELKIKLHYRMYKILGVLFDEYLFKGIPVVLYEILSYFFVWRSIDLKFLHILSVSIRS